MEASAKVAAAHYIVTDNTTSHPKKLYGSTQSPGGSILIDDESIQDNQAYIGSEISTHHHPSRINSRKELIKPRANIFHIEQKRVHAQSALLNNAQMVIDKTPVLFGAEVSLDRQDRYASPYASNLKTPQTSLLLSNKANRQYLQSHISSHSEHRASHNKTE